MNIDVKKGVLKRAILSLLATSQSAGETEGDSPGEEDASMINQGWSGIQHVVLEGDDVVQVTNDNSGAVWTDESDCDRLDVMCRRLNADGTERVDELDASVSTNGNQTAKAIDVGPDGSVVTVFEDINGKVWARLYDVDGVAVGKSFQVNTTSGGGRDARVAIAADGCFIVVWRSFADEIIYRRYSADGTPLDTNDVNIGPPSPGTPSVTM